MSEADVTAADVGATPTGERQRVSLAAFQAACAGPDGTFTFDVVCDGATLPVRLQKVDAPGLVIVFHGLIQRDRPMPVFPAANPVPPASVLAIADPSLLVHPDLTVAWYAGEEGIDTPSAVKALCTEAIAGTKATRVVFTGGSAGGFAALRYSWHVPGSVALAFNPQVNIDWHFEWRVDEYRAKCWPSLAPDASLTSVTESDLTRLYGREVPNMVVLAQNATDPLLARHFAPFTAAIPDGERSRFLPLVLPWSLAGHVMPPGTVHGALLTTVLTVPSLTAGEVLMAYMEHADQAKARRDAVAPPRPISQGSASQRDRGLARMLVRDAYRTEARLRARDSGVTQRGRGISSTEEES